MVVSCWSVFSAKEQLAQATVLLPEVWMRIPSSSMLSSVSHGASAVSVPRVDRGGVTSSTLIVRADPPVLSNGLAC